MIIVCNTPRGEWVPDPSYVLACTVGIAIKSFFDFIFLDFFPESFPNLQFPAGFPTISRRLPEGFPKGSKGLLREVEVLPVTWSLVPSGFFPVSS